MRNHLSVPEAWTQEWDAREWERHARSAGGALSAEFVDGARAGSGIVLGAILGLVLWLLIILATVWLVWL